MSGKNRLVDAVSPPATDAQRALVIGLSRSNASTHAPRSPSPPAPAALGGCTRRRADHQRALAGSGRAVTHTSPAVVAVRRPDAPVPGARARAPRSAPGPIRVRGRTPAFTISEAGPVVALGVPPLSSVGISSLRQDPAHVHPRLAAQFRKARRTAPARGESCSSCSRR